jgi:hypothetical protein
MLYVAGRLTDAHDYIEAAVASFRTFGEGAADACRQAEELLADIDAQVEKGGQQ